MTEKWIDDLESKCRKAWQQLCDAEADTKTQQVMAKVHHELEVARSKKKALGYVLGYDLSDGSQEKPACLLRQRLICVLPATSRNAKSVLKILDLVL